MLSYLYLLNACVLDVPMPARYRGEVSSMSIRRVLFEFSYKLTRTFWRRILLKYFIYDFSMMSVYLLAGIPLLLFGLIFGITKWIQYAELGVAAPTGTVILPTLSVILAIQILLSAIEIDVNAAPRIPISASHLSKPGETKNRTLSV
jgi:dolichol-phosphate mannosyltransferase